MLFRRQCPLVDEGALKDIHVSSSHPRCEEGGIYPTLPFADCEMSGVMA